MSGVASYCLAKEKEEWTMSRVITTIYLLASLLAITGCNKEMWQGECEKMKNKTYNHVFDLRWEDYPYKPGEVVLLKPDKTPAVIGCVRSSSGLYEIKYDETGEKYTIVKILSIYDLKYDVRYPVTKEQAAKQGEVVKTLRYETAVINWYEIYGKAD